jgi:hypothetical protein
MEVVENGCYGILGTRGSRTVIIKYISFGREEVIPFYSTALK